MKDTPIVSEYAWLQTLKTLLYYKNWNGERISLHRVYQKLNCLKLLFKIVYTNIDH